MEQNKGEVEMDHIWEIVYRPFPGFRESVGFDEILTKIADRLYEPEVARQHGDYIVSGHFDEYVKIAVSAAEPLYGAAMEQTLSVVAGMLIDLGMQGDLTIRPVVVLQEPVEL